MLAESAGGGRERLVRHSVILVDEGAPIEPDFIVSEVEDVVELVEMTGCTESVVKGADTIGVLLAMAVITFQLFPMAVAMLLVS